MLAGVSDQLYSEQAMTSNKNQTALQCQIVRIAIWGKHTLLTMHMVAILKYFSNCLKAKGYWITWNLTESHRPG